MEPSTEATCQATQVTRVGFNLTHVVIDCGYTRRFLKWSSDIREIGLEDTRDGYRSELEYDKDDAELDSVDPTVRKAARRRQMVNYLSDMGCEFIHDSNGLVPISEECRTLGGGPLYEFIKSNFKSMLDGCIVFTIKSLCDAMELVDNLMEVGHCGSFGHANLCEIVVASNDKYAVLGLGYDTESG